MTVHSLVLFQDGKYKELSKEFDLSIHNSILSPQTQQLVEDNYMTILYPDNVEPITLHEFTESQDMHLLESWELPLQERERRESWEQICAIINQSAKWDSPDFLDGFKMYRIHYYTETPTHWTLNPDADLFVFNSDEIKSMVLFN